MELLAFTLVWNRGLKGQSSLMGFYSCLEPLNCLTQTHIVIQTNRGHCKRSKTGSGESLGTRLAEDSGKYAAFNAEED